MINVNDVNNKENVILSIEKNVELLGGKKNEMKDRVVKKYDVKVELSDSKKYEKKMKLIDSNFEVKERKWGKRLNDSCVIENKNSYYLECFIDKIVSDVKYYLDDVEIDKNDIVGLKSSNMNEVNLVCYKFDNIMKVIEI
jgi:hypothetical protein